MRLPSFEKAGFVLSLSFFAFLYGVAAGHFDWFPVPTLKLAWNQAQASSAPPHFLEPQVYDRTGIRVVEPGRVQPGLTLIASWWKDFDGQKGLKLIDREGRILHEWRVDGSEVFPDLPEIRTRKDPGTTEIDGTYLFPNGNVLINIAYVGTALLDVCGRILWRLPAGNHHSISRTEDGSFWTSAGTFEPPAKSYPGVGDTYRDRLLHISEDGEVLAEIDVLEILFANGLQRHIRKASYKDESDITHLNDVEPLGSSMADEYPLFSAGDLVVSLRNLDLVFVLDPETKRVKWHASHPFIQQHDPDFIGNGWIGVFDNNQDGTSRGTMLGGSRIVALQPHTDSVKVLFHTPGSAPFYTAVGGKWQQLENGNLLLTEFKAGRIVEVGPDGRTVWEWVAEPYVESMVAQVSEGTRYDLTPQEVASWPCPPTDSTPPR